MKQKNKRLKSRGIIVALGGILILVIAAGIIHFLDMELFEIGKKFPGDTVEKAFFKDKGITYANDLLDNNGQTVTIDDYTFTLQQTLYDSQVAMGYIVIKIEKKDGKPEMDLDSNGQPQKNGIADRFQVRMLLSGGISEKYAFRKNTLYEYISFQADRKYDLTVDLVDYSKEDSESDYGYACYKLKIKDNSMAEKYQIDGTTAVMISPLGICIDCKQSLKEVKIEQYYKDGQHRTLIDSTKNRLGMDIMDVSTTDDEKRYQYVWKELKDMSQTDYIMFNDKKYKPVN